MRAILFRQQKGIRKEVGHEVRQIIKILPKDR